MLLKINVKYVLSSQTKYNNKTFNDFLTSIMLFDLCFFFFLVNLKLIIKKNNISFIKHIIMFRHVNKYSVYFFKTFLLLVLIHLPNSFPRKSSKTIKLLKNNYYTEIP